MEQSNIDFRELTALQDTLKRYTAVRKKSLPEILENVTRQVVFGQRSAPGLYGLTKAEAPKPAKILADARARHFATRIGGTATHRATVRRRAIEALGGVSSLQGKVSTRRGTLTLKATALERANATTPQARRRAKGSRLNLRNLEIIQEISLRQRASRHTAIGFLALDGKHRITLPASGSTARTVRRLSGKAGSVEFTTTPEGGTAKITNSTPGIARLNTRRNIVARALANARADMEKYIARKEAAAAKTLEKKAAK
jgi:hypothetical protein